MMTDDAEKILLRLEENGYEAFYVGGCVRDHLIGRRIHDIDITTNALPEQIMECFGGHTVVPTGLKHGTVTVIINDIPYEITTYRVDGEYSDSRRPDSVTFTASLEEDLARRDFTVNAMAMDKNGRIIDKFGGADDIKNGIIRCVGDPEKRFTEDALRILRAVRFSSQLGFKIEPETADAVMRLRTRLCKVSSERIRDEFDKLLCGENCAAVMTEYRDVIAQFIPEIRPCFDFRQHSHYHRYDVYTHIVKAVENAPNDSPLLKRTMFFHDIGKPPMFTIDDKGEGHFKGHALVSADMAGDIMRRLRYSSRDIELTCKLIAHHSDKLKSINHVKKMISKFGEEALFLLLEVKKLDNSAKMEFVLERNEEFDEYAREARRLIAEDECMKLSQLGVNGNDMLALGLSGREIGEALDELLSLVIDEKLPNDRERLLAYIKEKNDDKRSDTLNRELRNG